MLAQRVTPSLSVHLVPVVAGSALFSFLFDNMDWLGLASSSRQTSEHTHGTVKFKLRSFYEFAYPKHIFRTWDQGKNSDAFRIGENFWRVEAVVRPTSDKRELHCSLRCDCVLPCRALFSIRVVAGKQWNDLCKPVMRIFDPSETNPPTDLVVECDFLLDKCNGFLTFGALELRADILEILPLNSAYDSPGMKASQAPLNLSLELKLPRFVEIFAESKHRQNGDPAASDGCGWSICADTNGNSGVVLGLSYVFDKRQPASFRAHYRIFSNAKEGRILLCDKASDFTPESTYWLEAPLYKAPEGKLLITGEVVKIEPLVPGMPSLRQKLLSPPTTLKASTSSPTIRAVPSVKAPENPFIAKSTERSTIRDKLSSSPSPFVQAAQVSLPKLSASAHGPRPGSDRTSSPVSVKASARASAPAPPPKPTFLRTLQAQSMREPSSPATKPNPRHSTGGYEIPITTMFPQAAHATLSMPSTTMSLKKTHQSPTEQPAKPRPVPSPKPARISEPAQSFVQPASPPQDFDDEHIYEEIPALSDADHRKSTPVSVVTPMPKRPVHGAGGLEASKSLRLKLEERRQRIEPREPIREESFDSEWDD